MIFHVTDITVLCPDCKMPVYPVWTIGSAEDEDEERKLLDDSKIHTVTYFDCQEFFAKCKDCKNYLRFSDNGTFLAEQQDADRMNPTGHEPKRGLYNYSVYFKRGKSGQYKPVPIKNNDKIMKLGPLADAIDQDRKKPTIRELLEDEE